MEEEKDQLIKRVERLKKRVRQTVHSWEARKALDLLWNENMS